MGVVTRSLQMRLILNEQKRDARKSATKASVHPRVQMYKTT